MNWLTNMFRKEEKQKLHEVCDLHGRLVCHAWKPDYWSIAYLLWSEPKGEA